MINRVAMTGSIRNGAKGNDRDKIEGLFRSYRWKGCKGCLLSHQLTLDPFYQPPKGVTSARIGQRLVTSISWSGGDKYSGCDQK